MVGFHMIWTPGGQYIISWQNLSFNRNESILRRISTLCGHEAVLSLHLSLTTTYAIKIGKSLRVLRKHDHVIMNLAFHWVKLFG